MSCLDLNEYIKLSANACHASKIVNIDNQLVEYLPTQLIS